MTSQGSLDSFRHFNGFCLGIFLMEFFIIQKSFALLRTRFALFLLLLQVWTFVRTIISAVPINTVTNTISQLEQRTHAVRQLIIVFLTNNSMCQVYTFTYMYSINLSRFKSLLFLTSKISEAVTMNMILVDASYWNGILRYDYGVSWFKNIHNDEKTL